MPKKTANQILAENLARYMKTANVSCLALSKRAGVAANTIGNYLDTDPPVTTTSRPRGGFFAPARRLLQKSRNVLRIHRNLLLDVFAIFCEYSPHRNTNQR